MKLLAFVTFVSGLALVLIGLYDAWTPLAYIVAGVVLMTLGSAWAQA